MTEHATFAAPAPAEEADQPPALNQRDRDLDVLCEQWVYWCRTRRLYGPAPISGTVLGKMTGGGTRPLNAAGVDAICSAELSAFHIAYTCQPREALDRKVFDMYYVLRVKPIKRAADALGISRKHFYDLLGSFRERVANAAAAIQYENQNAQELMDAKRAARVALGQ